MGGVDSHHRFDTDSGGGYGFPASGLEEVGLALMCLSLECRSKSRMQENETTGHGFALDSFLSRNSRGTAAICDLHDG